MLFVGLGFNFVELLDNGLGLKVATDDGVLGFSGIVSFDAAGIGAVRIVGLDVGRRV